MDKVYFLVDWQKNKEVTWSGTCWGLYCALKKHQEIIDCNLHETDWQTFYHKCLRKLKLEKRDMNLSAIYRQRIKKEVNIRKGNVFQFAEVLTDTPQRKTFIYQDLSVDYVHYMHNTLPQIFAFSGYQEYTSQVIQQRKIVQNDYYQNCSGIFTMGQWLANDLIDRCGLPAAKIHHVGGGINLDKSRINYGNKTGDKILFVGRDFIRKGGELVLKAFSILKKQRHNAELYVAGPAQNPLPEGMNGYHYMGDCSHDKLSDLLNKCDIFVMPSHFEAYGLVFIEALTYGLPCIGRDAYEMPYFIKDGETGLLMKDNDTEQLASMMLRLLQDEKIKNNVRSRKDWYIKEYSWDTVAERIMNVINNT